ncbi:MAG: hypothetical protein U0792_22740 [Gemmataceae bacterium]
MNALVTPRVHKLSESLVELKVKVRQAMATELASAAGTAVRDILVVVILDRLVNIPSRTPPIPVSVGGWRDDGYDRWGEPKDRWEDADEYDRPGTPSRYALDEVDDEEPMPPVPTTAAIAVGVNVGRLWLARNGSTPTAVGLGILTTALGFAGGPFAYAALAAIAAATDLMTADSAVARPNLH